MKYAKYSTNYLYSIVPTYLIDLEFTDDYSYITRYEMIERLVSERLGCWEIKFEEVQIMSKIINSKILINSIKDMIETEYTNSSVGEEEQGKVWEGNRGNMGSCVHYKKHGDVGELCRKCIKKRLGKMLQLDRDLKMVWNNG